MSKLSGVRKLELSVDDLNYGLFQRYHRRIIYLEMMEPRFSSMHEAIVHFCLLNDGKMQEYEIRYKDSAEFYHAFKGFMDRYVFADVFRNYRFHTADYSYRVLIHKGATLDANNDLGGFVFQNNKTSFLISPYRREVFDRLQKDLMGYEDGVAQLVRVGLLLKNEKFCRIHNEFFGKIGLASLRDGTIVKYRYADSVANSNVITDQEMFGEYLSCVNAIPMSDFTSQSIVAKLAEDYHDTKRILMENYSNFLFADEDEIEFASILLGLFLHRDELSFSTEEWVAGISYIKYLNNDTFLRTTESEQDYKRNLGLYRANYILDKVSLPKLVHFIYDFFDYKNLSQNMCAFYPRLNALLGEDIREKYLRLETTNVSLKSLQNTKNPAKFFSEPRLVNFSTAADKEICKQILSGKYDHVFVTYYLCNYMQVADYKRYADVLPAVVSIIKNLQVESDVDYRLFWMACDLLNEFWKLIPEDNKELQDEIEKLIYDIFWPRIGDIWPIKHRVELSFNDEYRTKTFNESLGWIMSINNISILDRKLSSFLKEKPTQDIVNISDEIDKKRYNLSFAKQKDHSFMNFINDKGDEKDWCYAAIYCKDVSDVEIMLKIINAEYPLSVNKSIERYALEQLLLKTRDEKPANLIIDAMVDNYSALSTFFDKTKSEDDGASMVAFNALMALCESATNESEKMRLRKLAQIMCESYSDDNFVEKTKHALAVADAQIRQTKFQTKNITKTFFKKLH